MNSISEIFWSETFWFPSGKTWKDLENTPGNPDYLPQHSDMLWSIPIGLLFLGVRYFFENYLMTPLGFWMGVQREKKRNLAANPRLEEYFSKNGLTVNNNMDTLQSVAKQTDMSVREVERWLRDRKKQSVISDITRFKECGWHFTFYLGLFVYGLVILWQKSWFWETTNCWVGWPKLHVPRDVYWYYLIELSFYWCLVFSMMTEHKRKDFVQMIVHHIATILLMYFSWACNFVRIGTLVLVAHDAADFPMAAAKMMKYSGHKKLCEILLFSFIVVWILSRLIYYPFVVIYSASFEVYDSLEPFPAYYFFNLLLIVLQILHIIWSFMIARIALQKVFKNKLSDVRSDSESDGE